MTQQQKRRYSLGAVFASLAAVVAFVPPIRSVALDLTDISTEQYAQRIGADTAAVLRREAVARDAVVQAKLDRIVCRVDTVAMRHEDFCRQWWRQ